MTSDWFKKKKKRGYQHFDVPIDEAFALKATNPRFVEKHAFSPLIHYGKAEPRYKKCPETGVRKMTIKPRPIKYASHRDACILSFYAHALNGLLDEHYAETGLSEHVIAYRALGRANYHFAAEAYSFAKQRGAVVVLAFDVTGFFDNLDHGLLKARLKRLLRLSELPEHWYKIFRFMTRFSFVRLEDLKAHETFSLRLLKKNNRAPVATMAELKSEGITIHPNPTPGKGIPQGTPISRLRKNGSSRPLSPSGA